MGDSRASTTVPSAETLDAPDAADVVRLSRASLAWRTAALAGGCILAVLGTAVWNDGAWPFAPMSQFAFYVGTESEIRASYVDALWTDGLTRPMDLSAKGVGIGRAEIEGKIAPIVENPSMLQDLAVRQKLLHPDEPQPVRLWLRQRVTTLHDGVPTGTTVETLTEWTVTR